MVVNSSPRESANWENVANPHTTQYATGADASTVTPLPIDSQQGGRRKTGSILPLFLSTAVRLLVLLTIMAMAGAGSTIGGRRHRRRLHGGAGAAV